MRDWFLYMITCIILTLTFVIGGTKNYYANTTNTVSSTVTGTTTASAPSVIVNNQDVCTTGASAAVQTQILGIAGATVNTDENCERLKLSRALYGMGMKVAAVSVLCQDERVFSAMQMAGTPCPYFGTIGEVAQAGWDSHPQDKPGYKEPKNYEKYIVGGMLAIITGFAIF
jgi:hypothetical protein